MHVFNSTIERLDKKIDILKEENSEIKKEVAGLRENVQYHSDNVDEVSEKLQDIDSRVKEVKINEIIEDFVTKTKKELVDLEDCSCRNNLRFDGFQDETNETWDESESLATDFVKVRDQRRHLNWKSTSHRQDTKKWWDKK